jgi:hypothetical protein
LGGGGGVEFKESKISSLFFSPSNKHGYHCCSKRDNLGVPETWRRMGELGSLILTERRRWKQRVRGTDCPVLHSIITSSLCSSPYQALSLTSQLPISSRFTSNPPTIVAAFCTNKTRPFPFNGWTKYFSRIQFLLEGS